MHVVHVFIKFNLPTYICNEPAQHNAHFFGRIRQKVPQASQMKALTTEKH